MRPLTSCAKCHNTKFYVCENHQPESDSSNGIATFRVATAPIDQEESGSRGGSKYRTHAGTYETWICATCGYTEWYANDSEHLLERLSQMRLSGVRVVNAAPKPPYR